MQVLKQDYQNAVNEVLNTNQKKWTEILEYHSKKDIYKKYTILYSHHCKINKIDSERGKLKYEVNDCNSIPSRRWTMRGGSIISLLYITNNCVLRKKPKVG